MKKIYCILLSTILAASCTEQLVPEGNLADDETGEKTTLYFNPVIACETSQTKAMADNPEIHSIHVAVFDGQGYKLSEYVEASPCSYADENGTAFSYSVDLKVTTGRRILHFIANGPQSLPYGKETEVIGSLYTSIDADGINEFDTAYWQRVELLEGVPETPVAGSPDYAEKKAAYDRVRNTLNNVVLIRNYSKVTLKKNESLTDFTIYGFWILNYPNQGTIAPYNRNTKEFMSGYETFPDVESVESNASGCGNYQGFALATTQFLSEPFDNAHFHAATANVATGYVYEREKALDSPMYLIVKAKLASSDNASGFDYYKVAMQDAEGDFYAMLRNFNYLVKIQSVARKGANTPDEALHGAPTGDISLNVEFEELSNISDGDARLTISETVIVLAAETGNSITYNDFWYKYEPDIVNHDGTVYNGTTETQEYPFVEIDDDYEIGASGAVFQSFTVDDTDTGGQRYIHYTTVPVSPIRRSQSILITGKQWNGTAYETISRKVTFQLRETLDLDVSCGPNTDANGYGNVAVSKDHKVTVNLAIEADLPSQMFPLVFDIEAQNLTISPDNAYASQQELPVTSGYSKITGRGTIPSYWYEKTITWEEYSATPSVNAVKTIPCYFVTNTASSATPIYVTPRSVYFSQKATQLYNHTLSEFTGFSANRTTLTIGDPTNGTATVSYTLSGSLPEDGKVYVHMSKLEPVNTGAMTYVRTEDVGGTSYEVYEMDVNSLSCSLDVRGFDAGTGKLYLSAYKYADSSILQFTIRQNGILIYYDALKDNSSAQDFVTNLTSLNGASGNPVVGQKCTITIFVSEDTTYSNVQIGGSTATGKLSGSITVDGLQYWGYYLNNYSVGTTPGYNSIPVTVSGVSAGSAQLPVYGINISSSEVNTVTSGSFDKSAYYVIQNSGTSKYLCKPVSGTTPILEDSTDEQYSTDMLWKFGSTQSTSTILVGDSTTSTGIANASGSTVSLSSSPTAFTLAYTSGKGMTIYRSGSSKHYLYDNSGSISSHTSLSTSNNNDYWHVYKVSFTPPTTP